MKNVTTILLMALLLASLSITSCRIEAGSDDSWDEEDDASERDNDSDDAIAADRINLNRLLVYTADDEFIGYALDYMFDYIRVYIPAYHAYVTVHPTTGEYMRYPKSSSQEIYFADFNCTGAAVMLAWDGKIGSTYIYARNDRTYRIDSTTFYNMNNIFNAKSRLQAHRPDSEPCSNSNASIMTYAANLVEDDPMIDLAPYAPFQMFTTEE